MIKFFKIIWCKIFGHKINGGTMLCDIQVEKYCSRCNKALCTPEEFTKISNIITNKTATSMHNIGKAFKSLSTK